MSIRISAIVCTYNHANTLKNVLDSLIQQSLSQQEYEIIVVDNASTDGTSSRVKDFRDKYPYWNIILVYEAQQGLSHARNAGLQRASGKYVAYLDDDARADMEWLNTAMRIYESVMPSPICIGGPIYPYYTSLKPEWFKDIYETRTWGNESRFLEAGESFSGSNMIWKKGALEALGGFDPRLGVKGEYLAIGEETALFKLAWQKEVSAIFYYSPELIVYHWVPGFKMTVNYRLKRAFVAGQLQSRYENNVITKGRFRMIIGNIRELFSLVLKSILQRKNYSHKENWVIERLGPAAAKVGSLLSHIGLITQVKQS